jgi:microcompartment protein CcmL/EutN
MRYYEGAAEDAAAAARASLESRLLAAVAQMHKAIADAKDKVYATPSLDNLLNSLYIPVFGPIVAGIMAAVGEPRTADAAKTAIVNALNSIDRGVVGRLHGEIPAVLSGKVPVEKWMAAYQEVIKGVASQLDELKQNTMAAYMRQTTAEISRDIKSAWEKFLSTGAGALKATVTPLMLGVGLVVGWYLISWLPKRRN